MRSEVDAAEATWSQRDFHDAVEAYRQARHPYVQGDPGPVTAFFSRRDDVMTGPHCSVHPLSDLHLVVGPPTSSELDGGDHPEGGTGT